MILYCNADRYMEAKEKKKHLVQQTNDATHDVADDDAVVVKICNL